ncbi:hypothetical protein AMAG_13081 [Allomyces macrogynus ATCC 38327]|uniref:Programmed cell death protein 5 n=1 Tax=Allomyces macrogynus (strain ATCC 38327) TaxID=578462 RepID=A0A0L0T0Z8_ALLM3|nr:hypothetical protein AMAG_13081 [Allomyces macrogynus ATCC 38327]|eukprot:KNE68427.1 hypothetical protein AMAG_13081 [Allomyces macrogynus ATCC 38327]
MDDAELAQIRARRMAELQARKPQAGGAGGLPGGFSMPPGGAAGRGNGEDEEKKAAAEEMRKTMLMSVLDNDARERLARIAIVKPQNARAVEDMVLRMAQTGQLRGKVDEDQLIDLLGNISESKQSTKIVYNRRKALDSDDDDWD